MGLITNQELKDNFVQYQDYYIDENGAYSETVLTNEIALAEAKLKEYVNVPDSAALTDPLKLHLISIAKYRGFVRKHGDIEFENPPQIVKDYEATIDALEKIKSGERGIDAREMNPTEVVTMKAKQRRFGNADGSSNWFN